MTAARPGMVTSPHPLASEAGAAILARGGTAIEAAVAIAACLSVVMPHFCGIGGDAVWLVADRQGRQRCFLGIGQAAETLPVYKAAIPLRGPASTVTSACAVDSWGHALAYSAAHWGGTRPFADLLAPAIALARDGYVPSRSQHFWFDFRRDEIPQWGNFADHFSAVPGAPFTQPGLAHSLSLLAEDGYRSFYDGRLGKLLAEGLAAAGSPLGAADLAATRTREETPASLDYRGLTLLAPPAPTQGLSTLAIMGILAHFDLAALLPTSPLRYHLLVEAVKQAFLDRPLIADPHRSEPAPWGFLDPQRLAAKAAAIDPERALDWPHPYQHGDTVFFAATDEQGRCASVLQSTYFDWGSGMAVGDTGILWQNRGAAFSTVPGDRNEIQPGKRPFYTLNPGIALKAGEPHLLYGTQGADGQPQSLSVLLTGLIDYGMTPEEALAQPRFLLGKTFSDSHDSLKIEASLGEAAIEALAALGHEVAPLPALSPIFGQAGVIGLGNADSPQGAHDPRGEGKAVRPQAIR
ncbi:gamma-glutamyltransferase family protein [Azospirillum sp. B506]|uniref:gamma-glutamyltransferase family protein n=1 Tax=Azospirillum sp. B506 TaxID=137721 RepID=UPI00034BA231|nr:gamma-glutamyltransferase [Azospirillum sp. B506]